MTEQNKGNSPENGIIPIYNPKLLGELVRDVIGQHSLTAYAVMSGLSLSYLSKLTNGKLVSPPSKRTLARIANPTTGRRQGTATLAQMMDAAGYSMDEGFDVDIIAEETSYNDEVPNIADTPTFPLCLLLNFLLEEGEVGAKLTIELQEGIYEVKSRDTHVVALPAFGNREKDAKTKVKSIARSLITAYGLLEDDMKNVIYILTDQEDVYTDFEQYIKIPPDVKVWIAKTDDYNSYNKMRLLRALDC